MTLYPKLIGKERGLHIHARILHKALHLFYMISFKKKKREEPRVQNFRNKIYLPLTAKHTRLSCKHSTDILITYFQSYDGREFSSVDRHDENHHVYDALAFMIYAV